MTSSVFKVHLSRSAGEDLKPYIDKIIPPNARKMSVRARTQDSATAGTGSAVIGYVFEFIQNKDVCYTFAAIVISWIRAKNGKSVTIKNGSHEVNLNGLNEQELARILQSTGARIEINSDETKPT